MSEFRPDHLLVRDYVTAADNLQYTQLPESVVAVLVTHCNLPAKHLDIRLDLHSTIYEVKDKLRTHIGTAPDHQRLELRQYGNKLRELSDNNRKLGFYSVESGMEIHVIDTDPFSLSRGGGLTDISLIEKHRMADEDYDKRKGTIREFIREKRKVDPNYKLKPKSTPATAMAGAAAGGIDIASTAPGLESVEGISVGARCEVQPGARRGTVRFVGEIPELKKGGYWVGVQFDEPMGMNDGTVKGVRIFECADGYGAIVRGSKVQVGDFPERDLMDESDEEGAAGGKLKAEEEDEDNEDEI